MTTRNFQELQKSEKNQVEIESKTVDIDTLSIISSYKM